MDGESMSEAESREEAPDLHQGVSRAALADGTMLLGRFGQDDVLLVCAGEAVYAIGATCTHYGAPLIDGIVVEDTIRCPWHHACFALKSGAMLRPPALNDLAIWKVEEKDGKIFVRERLAEAPRASLASVGLPDSIVILGGGAAGQVAAETLRREGYEGPVTLVSADQDAPYDRPVLSKDYLAGKAQPDWVALRDAAFYAAQKIDLRLGAAVSALDVGNRELRFAEGQPLRYGALLLATGAQPVALDISGDGLPHVHLMRSLKDANGLIAKLDTASNCVVIGASFIGLEVAAALRQRGKTVHVVAPDKIPMARIMGEAIGTMVLELHRSQGVIFHLETRPKAITETAVILDNGEEIAADLVVAGIGVRPVTALAEAAGLATDRGVLVDDYLETSVPGIYAAGDIARWPDALSGDRIRVEHWVVAERQGQVAVRNMLGRREAFTAAPFFWSQHYETAIRYVGHAENYDDIPIDGDVAAKDFTATFYRGSKTLAVITVGRDKEALRAEVAFESEPITRSGPKPA